VRRNERFFLAQIDKLYHELKWNMLIKRAHWYFYWLKYACINLADVWTCKSPGAWHVFRSITFFYVKSPINVNKYRLRPYLDATFNIHNPLTASLSFGTTYSCNDCWIDSSNYSINSFWPRATTWERCRPRASRKVPPPKPRVKAKSSLSGRNYFITMHYQAGVHFENFTEVKFWDILLAGTGHRDRR